MRDLISRIKLSAGQIFWREAGESHRPVLIFLHGSWDDSRQWQKIVEPLSKNFHCFAIDLLGFGNSTAIEMPSSIETEVNCLDEFLHALHLRPVYLIGHSLGAWVAVRYALEYPDLVQGVVAIAPEGFSLTSWQQYRRFTKWLLAHPYLFQLWLKVLEILTSVSDSAYPLVKSQAYWNFFNKFQTTCYLFFRRSRKVICSELVADRLSQFRPPFLVLQSDADHRSTIEQSQSYAKAVRKSEYRVVQNVPSPELDLQFVREIKRFLDRVQTKIDREEVELW
ncbi:alpha/beta hydrolase [Chamaesiphon sp. VAR_48_metabat_135_sub]|uniref:alpha/beta fold hydrolase n=1 Tax=Chamaesiphon sp. VAR_48_metabat_135_sub TaxID=2964699 RepID=UPI00286A6594|nr:alpha/beta hydrolase [Chamaesiphon sp. VAR_48_metabat_135_sub]